MDWLYNLYSFEDKRTKSDLVHGQYVLSILWKFQWFLIRHCDKITICMRPYITSRITLTTKYVDNVKMLERREQSCHITASRNSHHWLWCTFRGDAFISFLYCRPLLSKPGFVNREYLVEEAISFASPACNNCPGCPYSNTPTQSPTVLSSYLVVDCPSENGLCHSE